MFSILEINGAEGICRAFCCVLLNTPLLVAIAFHRWEAPGEVHPMMIFNQPATVTPD